MDQIRFSELREWLPLVLTLCLLLTLIVGLGATYVGRGSSPYDMCEGSNGRQVTCATLAAARR